MFTPINASAKRGIKVKIKASENVNAPVVGEVNLYGESHALVIGINNYTQGYPILSDAVNDAKLVAAEPRQKGFDVVRSSEICDCLTIFNGIDSIVPIGTGKTSFIETET